MGGIHKKVSRVADPMNITGKASEAIVGDSGGKSRDPLRLTSAGQKEQQLKEKEEYRRKVEMHKKSLYKEII